MTAKAPIITATSRLTSEERLAFAVTPGAVKEQSPRHADRKDKAYRPTHGIDAKRGTADGILRAVDSAGFIQLDTLTELLELLGTKTDYRFHVAVEILPTGSALLKTIDNERDAKETIRRLRAKP